GYNYTGIGVYRATYSFTDELDGMSGTNIDFVDIEAGDDSTYSATIIGEEDNHKKVIQFLAAGDNGKYALWRHTETETSGTIEWWWKYIDNGVGNFIFIGIRTSGSLTIINVRFQSSDNTFKYQYGNGIGGTTVGSTAAAADTWHHIKITFSLATDTQSVWLNGVLVVDNENFVNDRTAVSMEHWRFQFDTFAGANSAEAYMDAYGESSDNDYMVGWNREEYAFFGDYNSTYSFENDLIGANPSGWVVDEGGGTVNVIGSVGNHKKVVELDDTDAVNDVNLVNTFVSVQTSGTIELWINIDDVTTKRTFIYGGGGSNFILFIDGDKWQYYDAHVLNDVGLTAVVNIWYHLKINFDCATDTYDIIIDGIEYQTGVDFYDPAVNIPSLFIGSRGNDQDYKIYLDAVDYSWSPGYSNGRNRLTENDDLLGHYSATHSFPFDDVGEAPEGWDSAVYTVIGSAWQEHRKVLKLTRDGSNPIIERDFYTDITSGTIELYMGSDDVTQLSHLRLYDGASSVIQINLYDDKLQYRYDGAYNPILDPILDNKWYHIKLDFETGAGGYKGLAADTFYITIDGTQYGPYPFNNVAPHVDKIYFTCNSGAVYNFYVDAIDYSWDPYYSVGRNINPTKANLLGQYPGTYSSESELVHTSGTEIDLVHSMGTGFSAEIIDEYDGHRKIMKVDTIYTVGAKLEYDRRSLGAGISDVGTVEFWFELTSGSILYFALTHSPRIVTLKFYPTYVRVQTGDGDTDYYYTTSGLRHYKIDFNNPTNIVSVWVEGVLVVDNEATTSDVSASYIDRWYFEHTQSVTFYVDSVSYSWDDNYLIGDNFHYNNFLGSETFEGYNATEPGFYYGTDSFDYNTEDEVYYGTYDFRDEADGTSGTSIDFVDFVN
ncbi:hypothetical protein LCGC14_1814210, partial [marine sediment metagenome]